jgi:hypothetical protein
MRRASRPATPGGARTLGAALLPVLLVLLTCAACAGGRAPLDDPSDGAGGQGILCMPVRTGGVFTDGGDVLQNHARRPAVVDAVRLSGASGLRLVDALIVPSGDSQTGYDNRLPNRADVTESGGHWNRRRPAVGFTLPPQTGENPKPAYNLVLGLRVTGSRHVTLRNVEVDYHVGGHHYRWHDITTIHIETVRKECASSKG